MWLTDVCLVVCKTKCRSRRETWSVVSKNVCERVVDIMDIVVESDHGVASGVSVSKVDQLKCHMFQRSLENSLKSKFKRTYEIS
jgi:hypothetical protein